nr:MAG TPA: hypothetical protein [Caudoviricetes sp.]
MIWEKIHTAVRIVRSPLVCGVFMMEMRVLLYFGPERAGLRWKGDFCLVLEVAGVLVRLAVKKVIS